MILIVNLIFQIINIAILVRVVLSWIPHNRMNPLIDIIYQITDPILKPIQSVVPPIGGRIDITPMIAMFLIQFLRPIIIGLLISF
tara:strand:- start:401 stop:655 length:255 start_codon:yes stop_codon:yes gene_type:complete